jgi:predicted PurR-regulated permease PerM
MAVAVAPLALVAVLVLNLTIALLTGMLVYVAIRRLSEALQRHLHLRRPDLWSIAILVAIAVGAGSLVVERATEAGDIGASFRALLDQMAAALNQVRETLPGWLAAQLPASLDALRTAVVPWLREHAAQLRTLGQVTLRGATYVLAGAIIGALAAVERRPAKDGDRASTPWAAALGERFTLFEQSFRACCPRSARRCRWPRPWWR